MAVASATSQQENRLLYLSFDNTLNGADGEVPTQTNGIVFQQPDDCHERRRWQCQRDVRRRMQVDCIEQ
ncbi:MAG: hypothetical protein ACREEM_40320 [Blastocatellia bacterium]